MGAPKGSQFQGACPTASGGAVVADTREAASPEDVGLVAAYSEDDDHDHDHDQARQTPPICQAKPPSPPAPASGCSDERATLTITAAATAAKHQPNGINTGESSARAKATHHDHPPTPGANPSTSPASSSADSVGIVEEREGDRCKTIEIEATTSAADRSSNTDHDSGKSAHHPSLDDLSALMPEEIQLSQRTLCKIITEEERGVELGGDSSSSAGFEGVVGDSPMFEVHLRVLLKDFPTASAAHFERGLLAALKRGIDDVVDNGEYNLPPRAKGALSSKAILYLVLLAVVVFIVVPLGSVCVLCGCLVLVWCNSRAKDKTNSSGDAVARSCHLLVVKEEENERAQGDRRVGDEEQGQACRLDTGGGGNGKDSNDNGRGVGCSSTLATRSWQDSTATTSATTEQEDAGFDFFLNGWGFCCPSRKGCCCCCGNKRAPLSASSSSLPPPPSSSCVDSRRPALLSVKPSKEVRAVRLIQLLKFADPRANAYLNDPSAQELLSGLELRPPLPPGHNSPKGLDGPFQ